MKRHTLNLFLYYYRQITVVNFTLAVVAGLLLPIGHEGLKGFLTTFMLTFITVGFAGGVYFFEIRKQKQYYLFYNAGLDRIRLFLGSFFLNSLIHIPTWFIWRMI